MSRTDSIDGATERPKPTWQQHLIATLKRCALAADFNGSVEFLVSEAAPIRGCIAEFQEAQAAVAQVAALKEALGEALVHVDQNYQWFKAMGALEEARKTVKLKKKITALTANGSAT